MKNLQKGFAIPIIIAIVALLAVGGGIYLYSNNKVSSPANVEPKIAVSQVDIDYMLGQVNEYVRIAKDKITKGNELLINISKKTEQITKPYEFVSAVKPNDPEVVKMTSTINAMKKIQKDMQDIVVYYEGLLVDLAEMETQIRSGQILRSDFLVYINETRQEMEAWEVTMQNNLSAISKLR